MQKNLLVMIMICLLIPGLSFIGTIDNGNHVLVNNSNTFLPDIPGEFDILEVLSDNIHRVDLDGNLVADSLERTQGFQDVIILFDSFDDVPTGDTFEGYAITDTMERLPGIFITIDTRDIDQVIHANPSIQLIEKNAIMQSHLAYSTSQLGVRSPIWETGYQGNGTHSIAIMDTGIDNTHAAFDGRIIANYNAINGNSTFPADDAGHGTHVASIAAGQNPTQPTQYTITQRGTLPTTQGNGFLDVLLANIESNSEINIELDWGIAGADGSSGEIFIQIFDTAGTSYACVGCSNLGDATGLINTSVTIPNAGDYYIFVGNENNAGGKDYEITVTVPNDQSISFTEDRHYGIAPNASLVNVKVLDSEGVGDSSNFEDGIAWVINNRETYNISVVNLSLGFNEVIASIDTLMADLVNNGVIPVVAAGNSGSETSGIGSPGSAPEAITVGAVNRANEMTYYSSYGNPSMNDKAMKPDVLAPGGSFASEFGGFETSYTEGLGLITAADLNNYQYDLEKDDLTGQQGTSMASPHIAGLASLMVQYMLEQGDWDFNSNTLPFKIKRAILSGTFEAANIGLAREEPSGIDWSSNEEPSLDRVSKDYFEGWGVVDARAAFNVLNSSLQINTTQELTFAHSDPFGRHSYAWNLDALKSVNYTFALNVPNGADLDIVIYDANSGPTYDPGLGLSAVDYGDLTVLASSTGSGDEYFGYNPTEDKEVIVVIKMVGSSNAQDTVSFTLSEGEIEPGIEIISPQDGLETSETTLTVEYQSTVGTVEGFLNGESLGEIFDGDIISDLTIGSYTLNLTLTDPQGVKVSDAHQFTIIAPETTTTSQNDQGTTSITSTVSSSSEQEGGLGIDFGSLNAGFIIPVIVLIVVPVLIRKNKK